jgi:hypothetical protein
MCNVLKWFNVSLTLVLSTPITPASKSALVAMCSSDGLTPAFTPSSFRAE